MKWLVPYIPVFLALKVPHASLLVIHPEGFRKDAAPRNQSIIASGSERDPVDAPWYPSTVLLYVCFEGPGFPVNVPGALSPGHALLPAPGIS